MYFSKVSLQNSMQAKESLVNLRKNGAYASHQLLWRLFPDEEQRQFLFREELATNGLPVFFMLSKKTPKNSSSQFDIQTKAYLPKLRQGDRLAYKLRVNPTICLTSKTGKSKRHDVLMHAKHQAKQEGVTDAVVLKQRMLQAAQGWMANDRRLNEWGFQLDIVPDIESHTQHRVSRPKGHLIQYSSVDMQGILTVSNPAQLIDKLALGFGKSKAFGCGLMMIRRI